mgnify:CR=1 FL=1
MHRYACQALLKRWIRYRTNNVKNAKKHTCVGVIPLLLRALMRMRAINPCIQDLLTMQILCIPRILFCLDCR